ncbi:MAG: MFS transporter [Actinomycetota bacterium]
MQRRSSSVPAGFGVEEPAPSDRVRPGSWGVLAAYVFLVGASHVLWISFASVTLAGSRAYHTSDTSIGLLVTVGPLCSAIFSIPAGLVSDRIGYRRPLVWAGIATSIFAFLRPAVSSFPLLLLLTIGMLVPQPFLINAIADLVNRHFPERESATATGIGTMSIFLGITVGVALTPTLVDAIGVRGSQLAYAGVSLIALAVFARISPRFVPDRLSHPEEIPIRAALRRVLHSRTQWLLSLVIFCGFGFYLGITNWLEEIVRPRGIGSSRAGLIAGMITLAGIFGSVALGALSDRWRRRKPFVILAGLVAAPCLWVLGHNGSFGFLIAIAAVMGFFLLAALPVAIAVVSEDKDLGPAVGSTGVGVILMFGNLGGVVIVGIMGALKSHGSFSRGIALTIGLAIGAAVLAVALPETARGRPRSVS